MTILRNALLLMSVVASLLQPSARADDLAELEQQALRAAADHVSDSVVQIRTVGGLSELAGKLLSQGPTTGLIVEESGYIVSSAANFAGEPTSILVRTASGEQLPAELVGRDDNRMLVLLKVEAADVLPIVQPVPKTEVQPGQWAVALGRVFDAKNVNLSVGVVSATNRMHGRAIQTDANVSTANYGGPLVDIAGRVYGVLVPLAPQPASSEVDELAGVEYYDSGIGFAIPLEDILANLPRWKRDHDLKRGLLGIGMTAGNPHGEAATITNVWPNSPAKKAGWQVGDVIVEVNGVAVASQTELRYQVVPHYAGDTLSVKIQRSGKDLDTEVELAAELPPLRHAFLGILPQQANVDNAADEDVAAADEPAGENKSDKGQPKEKQAGIVIRAVWPDSPAAQAGLLVEDRVVKLGDANIRTSSDALRELNKHHPGEKLTVEYSRNGKPLEAEVELVKLPNDLLKSVDLPAAKEPPRDAKLVEKPLKIAEFPHEAATFRPSHVPSRGGLLIWLEDSNESSDATIAESLRAICLRDGVTLTVARPQDSEGWRASDLAYLKRLLGELRRILRPDPQRVVIAGVGKSGQLALQTAFANRELVAGVATVGTPLPRTFKVPTNQPAARLAVLLVEQGGSPFSVLMRRDAQQLNEAGFPTTLLTVDANDAEAQVAKQAQLDAAGREQFARWLATLNRF